MINVNPKTPTEMMEVITSEIIEAGTLLETIYRNSNENHETDCAISCLIRSLNSTRDKTNIYVDELNKHQYCKNVNNCLPFKDDIKEIVKSKIESLHDNVDAIHCTAKMLLNAFKNDPDADEFCKYEGVIQALVNMSLAAEVELFAIKQDMKDE